VTRSATRSMMSLSNLDSGAGLPLKLLSVPPGWKSALMFGKASRRTNFLSLSVCVLRLVPGGLPFSLPAKLPAPADHHHRCVPLSATSICGDIKTQRTQRGHSPMLVCAVQFWKPRGTCQLLLGLPDDDACVGKRHAGPWPPSQVLSLRAG